MSESSPWLESGLNVDALRYFLAAIELGSFQAAAERLHVTPQAVGKAIAALEARLGPLVVRDRRLRGLTPTGRALAAEARGLVAALSSGHVAGEVEKVRAAREAAGGRRHAAPFGTDGAAGIRHAVERRRGRHCGSRGAAA